MAQDKDDTQTTELSGIPPAPEPTITTEEPKDALGFLGSEPVTADQLTSLQGQIDTLLDILKAMTSSDSYRNGIVMRGAKEIAKLRA